MKMRKQPYGYKFEHGKVVIYEKEFDIVKEIYRAYLAGKTMSMIADDLNTRKIEYMPGALGWNKARLKRILEDQRYLGEKGYPKIIETSDYAEVQKIKDLKNPLKNIKDNQLMSMISVPILCPKCREKMHRKCDNRLKNKVRWRCLNGHAVYIDDESLLEKIIEHFQTVTSNVENIKTLNGEILGRNSELLTLQNKIELIMEEECSDEEETRERLFEHASKKYSILDDSICKTQHLKDIFSEISVPESFSKELFEKTTDAVILEEDGAIGIVLMNGQEL